jgi:2-desacetyl-2-hydroxyethyl bacteriochlorophyllide A dehydrogenase
MEIKSVQALTIKNFLKNRFKPVIPAGFQDMAVNFWNTVEIPLSALLEHKSIMNSMVVFFPVSEVADFKKNKTLGPGSNEVLVKANFTAISPGTERAFLMELTNPRIGFPFFPGYSGSGEVVSVGKMVKEYKVGDLVAGRLRHGSFNVLSPQFLFLIPPRASLEEAAFIELGIIVLQGIRKARIKPGESILVIGQGLVGQLANRLSRIAGGAPVVATARSRAKATQASQNGGADYFFTIDEMSKSSPGERFDVVIEATGDPLVLPFACGCAKEGGRVVLLGSPRSQATLPVGQNDISPGITLIGAHISGMPEIDQVDGLWIYRNEGDLFLDLIAEGRLTMKDLITHKCDPSQAGFIYESLKSGTSDMIGALLNWTGDGIDKTNDNKDSKVKNEDIPTIKLSKRFFNWKVELNRDALQLKTSTQNTLRVGIVGGGDIGLTNINGVQAAPNACVAALFDTNPEVLRDLAQRYDKPATTSYESLLDRTDVDAVLLSVPHMLHAPLAIQAAKAGKHVMLEKPLGVNLKDAQLIIESCNQAKVRLTINYSFRYLPVIQLIRQLIKDGLIGNICGVQINHLAYKGASYWAGGFSSRAPSNWRGSKEKAGGGVLIMNICHAIDYLRYTTGLEFSRVYSEYGTFASPVEVEDQISVSCQFDNGANGTIAASSCWKGTPLQELRIWGTQGSVELRDNRQLNFWSARRWKDLAPGKVHSISKFPLVNYTSVWIQKFAEAIFNNQPHEIAGRDGWINNAIVEAAYKSRETCRSTEIEAFPWEK